MKQSPETSAFSAAAYEHNHELLLKAQSINPDTRTRNPGLDNLLRHAYIPTPNLIHGMPVIGPIPLSKEESVHFLSWVKGPLLHDQLSSVRKNGLAKLTTGLHHNQLWVVSQMTGIWQAHPHIPENAPPPEDLEEFVKIHYVNIGSESISEYACFVDLPVSKQDLERAQTVVKGIVSNLRVSADPLNGNIGRYFDAALRNFITELGDVNATSDDILNRVVKDGIIDYYGLWDMTRRIDFSHADRLWCIYDEDIAHITENCHVKVPQKQKTKYQAATMLTRLALKHYDAYEKGQGDKHRHQAIDIAGKLQDLRTKEEVKPSDIKEFETYRRDYAPTNQIIPWLRKLRQGVLALVYLAKTYAHEEQIGIPTDQAIREGLASEAHHCVSRVIAELPSVINAAGIKRGENVTALKELLEGVRERIDSRTFSESYMMEKGQHYLNTLR